MDDRRRLPLHTEPAAVCAACPARCCRAEVPLTGYDVVRLASGLRAPWSSFVDAIDTRDALHNGFRLDGSRANHVFHLRRTDDGDCTFLHPFGGQWRCSVYDLRPSVCRAYPYIRRDGDLALTDVLKCADDDAPIFAAAPDRPVDRAGIDALVDEDAAEWTLYWRLQARWNAAAIHRAGDEKLSVDDFVAWLARAYAALAPLRTPVRGDWQLGAYALVDALPVGA